MISRTTFPIIALILSMQAVTFAAIENGNAFALDVALAPTATDRADLIDGAMGKLYFFRYLRITEREDGYVDGRRFIRMRTVEPSSQMSIHFIVRKPVSLKKANPIAKGTGIAVTGRIKAVEFHDKRQIVVLDPVIVRHADRLKPVVGKEMLHEVDPDSRRKTKAEG
jgi:hypothetical protein